MKGKEYGRKLLQPTSKNSGGEMDRPKKLKKSPKSTGAPARCREGHHHSTSRSMIRHMRVELNKFMENDLSANW
jgi:hypothetical protein